jgi:alpha-glucosidase (family GH31 glycosyl hydrolase)
MEHNQKFENSKIPLDVLWMDLPYTDQKTYFVFHPYKFQDEDMNRMK